MTENIRDRSSDIRELVNQNFTDESDGSDIDLGDDEPHDETLGRPNLDVALSDSAESGDVFDVRCTSNIEF